MDISVNFLNDQFELSLGACKAKLSSAELLLLRENLAQELLKSWQKPAGFWEEQQAKLDDLKYIAFALAKLDEALLEKIVINNVWCQWLPLLGFTRLILPKLADNLQSIIENRSNKKSYLFFSSPEAFMDQLHLEPDISSIDVIETLTNIKEALKNYSPEITQLLAEQQAAHSKVQPVINDPVINDSIINDKAFSFLDYLGNLPASNLRLILKKISRKELELLFSTCKMLKAVKLFEQLRAIFPDNLFQQFDKNCPAKVEEHEVRSLLSKLNSELKELKELLNTRKQP